MVDTPKIVQPKKNRRKTKKSVAYNGIKFRSKYEAKVAEELDNLGLKWDYEQCTITYVPPTCTYTPDFRITYPDGTVEFIEVKGYLDPLARSKMLCVRQQYPNINLSFHFMRDNKLGSSSKMHYTDWAKKHGFGLRQDLGELKLINQKKVTRKKRVVKNG